ncbi:thiamine pyrophosphate-binding protein [Pseudohoeflea coraliihabitans]|uniref:Thiamine pyrophosphate-binding protein n=1 Tax=Pseudohoeflea coraliihabitans TaxID=2860393 RepID=A0ABS6WL20_9HYPH|nr:thiamine pyrophosphate-binding protein [Pseudohoeflea sp. DP4N28-3]MBW3096643.1 thiamine pyrophosphate-binding protein [Pseudohoeflea sp. DP4N28-3]
MSKKTVWRAVAEALKAEGVGHVFGLPGNPKHLVYDLDEHTDIDFVLVRDEKSAVSCAYSYARLRRQPGIVFSNPGPGITTLVTGMLEATSGSLPVIAIVNGVVESHDGMGAFQELDAVSLMRPVTKWAVRVTDAKKIPWVMERAFAIAMNGRPGGVFIEIPSDLADAEIDMPDYRAGFRRHLARPDKASIEAAAKALAAAKRPLIWCGSGAVFSGAAGAVQALADKVGMAVMTTPGGRGIYPEDGPLAMGQTGLYFSQPGKSWFDEADLVLSVGTRLEAFSTNSWQFWPEQATFIQLDIDPETIGMNKRPDIALIGDATLALNDLAAALPAVDAEARDERINAMARLKADYQPKLEAAAADDGTPIRVPKVLDAVNRIFGKDTILMKENGGADLWCYYWPHYKVLDVDDCVPMAEQTAMSMGAIGAIGAKIARPEKKIVCFAGDGAMQMSVVELATAAERRCGITWIVLNNQAFGWVQYNQVLGQKPFVATGFEVNSDFAAIARAQACVGIKVEDPAKIDAALEEALAANTRGVPALIDVQIAPHLYHEHFERVHRAKIDH